MTNRGKAFLVVVLALDGCGRSSSRGQSDAAGADRQVVGDAGVAVARTQRRL